MIRKLLKFDIQKTIKFCFATNKYPKKESDQNSLYFQKIQLPRKAKISKEIKENAESLIETYKKEASKVSEIENMRVQDVYKKMDSTLEGFFYKRKYNLFNFNFLLQILSEKKQYDESLKILDKMKEIGINPDVKSYTFVIKTCAKNRKIDEAEKFFLEARKKFGEDKYLYTSLMNCYARSGESNHALKIFQQMKEKGLEPDVASYTTLINSFYKGKNLKKCWDLFDEVKTGCGPDEHLMGLMIEICAHSHDAEKAISLYEQYKEKFSSISLPYNALIKALGSRTDYAKQAIEKFHQMTYDMITPDQDSYLSVMKACSTIGDVKTAYDIVKMMRGDGFEITKYIYNEMLRTYAGAVAQEYTPNDVKEVYIKDSWNLLEQIKKEKKLSIQILNSLLLVHCNAIKPDQVEGLVLPLYDQFQMKKNEYTYETLMEMYSQLRDIQKVNKIYDHLTTVEKIKPTYKSLNNYLEMAMRTENVKRIVEALKEFKKIKMEPKIVYLKRLGESQNLPPEVYLELVEFEHKFGFVLDKVYRSTKPDKHLEM